MDTLNFVNRCLCLFFLFKICKSLVVEYVNGKLPVGEYCHRLYYDGDDSIYIFGECFPKENKVLKYSLGQDIVSQIGTIPIEFTYASVQPDVDGNIFLFGGGSLYNQILKYDIKTNTTSLVATLPYSIWLGTTVSNCNSSIPGNSIIVLGNDNTSRFKASVFDTENYNIKVFTTSVKTLESVSAICVSGRVFIFLSENGNGIIWELDLEYIEFYIVGQSNLPYLSIFPSVVSDGNLVYIIAGIGPNKRFSGEGIFKFDPSLNSTTFLRVENWPVKDNKWYYSIPPQCAYVGKLNRIYCFGGFSFDETSDDEFKIHDEIFYIEMRIESKEENRRELKMFIIICTFIGILIIISYVVYKIMKIVTRATSIEQMYNDFKYGLDNTSFSYDQDYLALGSYYKALEVPFPKLLEISPERLKLDEDTILGRGAYGTVFQGMLDNEILVAIKTVTKPFADSKLAALLSEVKIMNFVGEHQHIVQLLGVQCIDLMKGDIFVALEFCSAGSLEKVVHEKKAKLQEQSGIYQIPGYFTDLEEWKQFSTDQLIEFCSQVCSGMEFMAAKGIVHGDLTSRNVLLDSKHRAKISDFGLSWQIFGHKNYATAALDTALPWRWFAIETIHSRKFSHASDCWAFGILVWEVFSLADLPYSEKCISEVIELLESGSRLKCPKSATHEIYELMKSCWAATPCERPSFSQLLCIFEFIKTDL